jgi:hypothetical protein
MLRKLLGLAITAMLVFLCVPDVVAAEIGYAPQISDKQSIKITVAPRNILETTKNWDFEVTVESHTQDLSDDLTKSALLIADGKQYLPLGWEGAPPGGHHRKGLLRFKTITQRPSSIELQIRLADDATPRSFKWLLK